jgi:DNA-binding PadR family transcriptional regulator
MSVPHVLLALLTGGDRHGYELKHAYDARFPQARPLAFGQVYSTLERLRRDGLVEPARTEQAEGPERMCFAVTPAGRESLASWLSTVEPPAPHVANALFAKVVVALLTRAADRDAAASAASQYLRAQREAHLERMRAFTRIKTDPDALLGATLSADYAIAHLDADLRWIDTTLARVAALTEEVIS